MAIVDSTGAHSQSLSEHRADLERRFRAAFGDDLALQPETPQGQIIGLWAAVLAEHDEQVVAQANALSVDHATGRQLDDLGSNLDIPRTGATRSRVTATLTGTAGTTVPRGSRARTADNAVFETLDAAILSPTGVAVEMQAVEDGPVVAAAGALSLIVTLVPGWETVTNAAAAAPGLAQETDADFRDRYQRRTANSADGPLDALRAALTEAGAIQAEVVENASSAVVTKQGYDIQPYSIICIVRGGTDAALTAAVLQAKGMGVSPMTEIGADDHSALATIQAAGTSFEWAGENFTGLSLTAATTLAAVADAVEAKIQDDDNALIAQTQVAYQWHADGRFVAVYPWRPGPPPAWGDGALETALGFDDPAIPSPGPFVRAQARALAVTAAITIDRARFPADGLNSIRQALIDRVDRYRIGERPWQNDLLGVVEAIDGTQVTAFAATDGTTAINSVTMPLTAYYTLAATDITIDLTEAT